MKKKNRGTNWGLLVFVLLFMIAAVFGYSFIQFYQERHTSTVVDQRGGNEVNSPDRQSDPEPASTDNENTPEDDEEVNMALYEAKLNELHKSISKMNESVGNALEQLGLHISNRSTEEQSVALLDDISLNWEQVKGTIKIPSGKYTLSHVNDYLVTAAQNVGGEMIRTTQEGESLIVYLGLVDEGTEIITHQLKLTVEAKAPAPTPKPKPSPAPTKPRAGGKAKLAFVIDDLGYEWPEFDRMMTIPRPMTFAVIPHLPHSTQQAKTAWSKGYDLILHQPMEPSTKNNPGEGAIYTSMSEDQIVKILSDNLASLPQGVIGSNNHMGSKATADPRVMEVVLRFFRDRGLFFIDSHTAPNTVVAEVARDVGESFGENRIFLDNVDELEPIKEQIRKAAKIALRDGYAITIGHVRKYTAKAILAMIDEIEAMGIEIVPAKELLERY